MRTPLAILLSLVPTAALAQPPPPPAPGYAPAYAPQPAENLRRGLTFEANLGLGFMWATSENDESDKKVALGGLDLGVGGWINPRMALSLRIAGVTYTDSDGGVDLRWTTGFAGPSLQYWLDDHMWFGGGAGLGFVAVHASANGSSSDDSETGLGLDLRAGYTFSTATENTWNLSFELNPSFIEVLGQKYTFFGMGILLGYQHL